MNRNVKNNLLSFFFLVTSAGAVLYSNEANVPVAPTPIVETPVVKTGNNGAQTITQSNNQYKDGTYTKVGNYLVPEGRESIIVSVAVKNDVVVSVHVVNEGLRRDSIKYQNRFASAYSTYVIGKKIGDIHLTTVSGSSLTPKGFNAALDAIKTLAKA